MGKSAVDAQVNQSIFRKNFPIIIAAKRANADILGIRLTYDADGYMPGQVLARNTSTGLYDKYSAISGSYEAACVLLEQITDDDQPSTGGALARGIFGGGVMLYTDLLLDYDANSKADLGARDVIDAANDNITIF